MELGGQRPSDDLADDEMSSDEDDDEAEHTLTPRDGLHPGGRHMGDEEDDEDDPRAYSTSPSRLDGGDIFHDLSEMSNFADRIDSILDQTVSENSTRSGRMRSLSPMPQMAFELEQQQQQQQQLADEERELEDGEVD